MKPKTLTGFILALLTSITFTGKAGTFHIDGYVVTETEHHAVKDQIVEIVDETGNPIAWFNTEPNGLYSGDFETDVVEFSTITVEVSRTCDNEVVVYSQSVTLDNPYLICNFFVCDGRSCRANFYYTQIGGDNLVFQFTDVSTGNITSWFWDFGDGQTSTIQNPVHQYQEEDHYYVVLGITTDSCTDTEHRWINAFHTDCLADFSYEQVNQGNDLMVHFFDESTGDYNHIHWDFGDGGMPSIQPNPWHQYYEPGDYEVELHIWGQEGGGPGCDHITKKIIRVQPASTCYALFTSVQNHSDLLEVQFTDASIGQTDTWAWEFGDQTISSGQNPLHVYENPGEYQVHFEISGPEGSSSFSRMIYVQQNNACIPDFAFNQPSIEEPLILFENLSVGENLDFLWNFGDGTTSSDTTPVHLFPIAGSYEVKLKVTGFGCVDSITKVVEVSAPPPCHAEFSFSSQSPESLEISFINTSSGLINNYLWDFGDGETSSEENPIHIYGIWGDYNVLLTIDAVGCQDSVEHLVQITEPEYCEAAFSVIQEYPQNPLVSFVNESVGINFSSFWDFGDGFASEETNPLHEFAGPGLYLVKLTIQTSGNCMDSASHNVEILPPLTISGSVMAGASLFGYGNIFLLKSDTPAGCVVFDRAPLGSGNFEFSGLTPGSYLLQAIPDFNFPYPVIPNYFPTYFGDNSRWADAEILLTNDLPETVIIHLSANTEFFDGPASIQGVINLMPDDNPVPAVIFIIDESGEVADYNVVDESGGFAFDEIPYGIYQLFPEKAGKSGVAINVEVSENKPDYNNIVFIETATRIYPDLTFIAQTEKTEISIYPNPTSGTILINIPGYNNQFEQYSVHIFTTSGKIAGSYIISSDNNRLDVSNLVDGMYFLQLSIENERFHRKLIIER